MILLQIQDSAQLDVPVFDFHRHLERVSVEDMTAHRITSACIMPSWKTLNDVDFATKTANDFTDQSRYKGALRQIHETFAGWHGALYTFLPIDFTRDATAFSDEIETWNPAGVKLHPLQRFSLDKNVLDPYFKVIQAHELIVYIHTDWPTSTDYGKFHPVLGATFGKLARWYKGTTFILGHAGNNDSYLNIWKLVKQCPNCIIETSMAPTPSEIDRTIARLGADRIVFGSNFPYCNTSVEITRILMLERATEVQKRQIFSENAEHLLANRPREVIGA